MEKILITGINGFAGSHLTEYILKNKLGEVHGTVRSKNSNLYRLKESRNEIELIYADITKKEEIKQVIKKIKPDKIFHLAANSFVPESFENPKKTFQTNLIGTMNLFEATKKYSEHSTIVSISSSEAYGLVLDNEFPIKETNAFRPLSPYGTSKASMDLLGYQYFKSHNLKIIRLRPFNHTGPKRSPKTVDSDWCKQIIAIEKGKQKPEILIGNIENIRDFLDVRDIVKAYWIASEKGKPGEAYNICSGKGLKLTKMLEILLKQSSKKIKTKIDIKRIRKSPITKLIGDPTKFMKETKWKPEISIEQMLKDVFEYWKEVLS